MRKYLENLPKDLLHLVYLVKEAAEHSGHSAYLVGGFVRDLILGVKNFDLDIVVEKDGIRIAEILSQKLKAKLVRHRRFGTATVILGSYHKIDITTARREFYPEPAALPHVSPGMLQDDLFRRDFTINALAIDITGSAFGTLVDCYGGKKDLHDGKIRILHQASFIDDPTRILRCIRFEQRFDFTIEPGTLSCLKQAVKLGMLEKVQPQRLRDDLILMLKEEYPLKEIRRMRELTGFRFIDHGLTVPAKSRQLFKNIEYRVAWFKKEFPGNRHIDTWLIYFMALVEPLSVRRVWVVLKKFVFPRGVDKRVAVYKTKARSIVSRLSAERVKVSEIFNLLEPLSYEVILLLLSSTGKARVHERIVNFLRHHNGTRLSIGGKDLLALGLDPGPHYQKILHRVLAARLDGEVKTKEEELEFVKRIITKQDTNG